LPGSCRDIFGHRQVATTNRFVDLVSDPLKVAASPVSTKIAEALNGKPPREKWSSWFKGHKIKMKLEWDEEKRRATLAERRLDFADCAEIFAGPRVVKDDTRKEYGERREIMLGPLRGQIVAVVFTQRGDRYRIISMRYANEKERRFFESKLGA